LAVDCLKLISSAAFLGLNPLELFSGDEDSDYPVARLLDNWANGKFIDPPTIGFDSNDDLVFTDGRHRTIVAHYLGEKRIPIAVANGEPTLTKMKKAFL
jgi:hypothetical protein